MTYKEKEEKRKKEKKMHNLSVRLQIQPLIRSDEWKQRPLLNHVVTSRMIGLVSGGAAISGRAIRVALISPAQSHS